MGKTINEFRTEVLTSSDAKLASLLETAEMLEDECFAEVRPADFAVRKEYLEGEIKVRASIKRAIEEARS